MALFSFLPSNICLPFCEPPEIISKLGWFHCVYFHRWYVMWPFKKIQPSTIFEFMLSSLLECGLQLELLPVNGIKQKVMGCHSQIRLWKSVTSIVTANFIYCLLDLHDLTKWDAMSEKLHMARTWEQSLISCQWGSHILSLVRYWTLLVTTVSLQVDPSPHEPWGEIISP